MGNLRPKIDRRGVAPERMETVHSSKPVKDTKRNQLDKKNNSVIGAPAGPAQI